MNINSYKGERENTLQYRMATLLQSKKVIVLLVLLCLSISVVSGTIVSGAQKTVTCQSLDGVVNKKVNASPIIDKCIENAKNNTLLLSPGEYLLKTPLNISRSIKIESINKDIAEDSCKKADVSGCAVIVLGEMKGTSSNVMPVEIDATNVTLSHIAIVSSNDRTAQWKKSTCENEAVRPLAGGVRVNGSSFVMDHSIIRGMSCYTAMEIVPSSIGSHITNNIIGPNGVHKDNQWADGITIHDSRDVIVSNNIFKDNTDVQLIFGGCLHCVISNNIFVHGSEALNGSFAELMIHAWPNTSGNFYKSRFFNNTINCGVKIRCGYGIMIGGQPWYDTKARGGEVTRNSVKNAMVGINVDSVDGDMIISGNQVTRSGGYFNSDCGAKNWPAINISKISEKYIGSFSSHAGNIDTKGCIINRIDNSAK